MGSTLEAGLEIDGKEVVVVRGSLVRNPNCVFRCISVDETRSSKPFYPESNDLLTSQLVEEMLEHAQSSYGKRISYIHIGSIVSNFYASGVSGLLNRGSYDNLFVFVTELRGKFIPALDPPTPDTLVEELSSYGNEHFGNKQERI